MSNNWGVLLQGHEFDLLDWLEGLHPSFDPRVERRDVRDKEEFVLLSEKFQDAQEASEVRQRALGMITEINGAMAIRKRGESVTLKNVADFQYGEPRISGFAEGQILEVRCRLSAAAMTFYQNGEPVLSPPPVPSAPQSWFKLADQSDDVSDLLTYAARADNWFDIYKMIEATSLIAGGEHALIRMCGPEIKDAKERANEARHHRIPYKPKPLSLGETKAIAFRAADIALSNIVDPD